jgi:hypothetical protein
MDEKIKLLIQEAINEKREKVIAYFPYLFQYPFHPDTTFILLEVRGDGGDFGVTISPMNGWGTQLFTDANGEELKLEGAPFMFSAYEKLEQELSPEEFEKLEEDEELVEEMDSYVKDSFVPFFQECFNKAGGKKSKLPYYLYYPNSAEAYDLLTEKWLETF